MTPALTDWLGDHYQLMRQARQLYLWRLTLVRLS